MSNWGLDFRHPAMRVPAAAVTASWITGRDHDHDGPEGGVS
jgi:hypothetical protein